MATTDNKIVTHATIFTDDSSHNTPSYIYAKQYDKNSRYICITLMSMSGQIVVSTTSRLNMTKPDGNTVYTDGTYDSDGNVTFKIPANVMDQVGVVNCDVTVYSGNNQTSILLTSSTFYIVVDKSNYDLDAPPGSDDYVMAARAADLGTSVVDDETIIHLVDTNGEIMGHGVPFSGGGVGGVQADWNQPDTSNPSYIRNKPTIPPAITVDSTVTPSGSNPVASSGIYDAIQTAIEEASFDYNNYVDLGLVTPTPTVDYRRTFTITPAQAEEVETSFRTRQDSMVLFHTQVTSAGTSMIRHYVLRKSFGNLNNDNAPLAYTGTTTTSNGTEDICLVNAVFTGTTCSLTIIPVESALDDVLGEAKSYTNEAVDGKEDVSNKTQTIDVNSTGDQYPSAQATYNAINSKRGAIRISSFSSVIRMTFKPSNNMYSFSYASSDYSKVVRAASNGGSDDLLLTITVDTISYTGSFSYGGIRGDGGLNYYLFVGTLSGATVANTDSITQHCVFAFNTAEPALGALPVGRLYMVDYINQIDAELTQNGTNAVQGSAIYNAIQGTKANSSIYYVRGEGSVASASYRSSVWCGENSAIPSEYYEGLTINYKIEVAGNATYNVLLRLNGEDYEHPVITNVSTTIGTRYAVGSILTLTYDPTFDAGALATPLKYYMTCAKTALGTSSTDPTVDGATLSGHDTWTKGEAVLYDGVKYVLVRHENIGANWVAASSTSATYAIYYPTGAWKVADYDSNSNTVPSIQVDTAAATVAKVGTCTYFAIGDKHYAHVNVRYTNTAANITLNTNSTGAMPVYINDVFASGTNNVLPAGTYIVQIDHLPEPETYDTSVTYTRGDFCVYNSARYICIVDSTTGTYNKNHWLAIGGTYVYRFRTDGKLPGRILAADYADSVPWAGIQNRPTLSYASIDNSDPTQLNIIDI